MNEKWKKELAIARKKLNDAKDSVVKYVPVALTVISAWLPVSSAKSESFIKTDFKKQGKEIKNDTKNKEAEKANLKYLLAEAGSPEAYNMPLTMVSTMTEADTLSFENPAAVATGNGYYGQNQLSLSNAKRFVVYAMANGSEEIRQAFSGFLRGNSTAEGKAKNNKKIDAFLTTIENEEDVYEISKRYLDAYQDKDNNYVKNTTYTSLIAGIDVNNFSKNWKNINGASAIKDAEHKKDFIKAVSDLQSNFIYEVYAQIMPINIQKIQKDNPHINFEEVHPSVYAAWLAIAIKQGNGTKINNSLKMAKSVKDINNKAYLKAYCGTRFTKVYKEAEKMIDKRPSLNTIYEISRLLDNSKLYDAYRSIYQDDVQESIIAWAPAVKEADKIQKVSKEDIAKMQELSGQQIADNTSVVTTKVEEHRATSSSKTKDIQKIMEYRNKNRRV